MKIQFGYQKKQVLQALRYHFITRPEIKVLLVIVNVFTILSAILLYMHKIQPLAFLIFSFLWFLFLISIWKFLPSNIYRKSQTFQDNFQIDFGNDAIILETDRGSQSWYWNNFSAFLESPYFFHLYFNSRSFFLVPKDAFKDISDLQEIRQLLRSRIHK
jgi:hypothetical protein